MIQKTDISVAIKLFNYYRAHADRCFDIYPDICEAYFMFDYCMEIAEMYERVILEKL